MKRWAVLFVIALGMCGKVLADESWQEALGRMPLGPGAMKLTRTNAIPAMLNAFQSNQVVKALIFMPGAADEFVFYRRASATVTNANPSLADAIAALTNQTSIRVAFHPPFLLLYTGDDALEPIAIIKSKTAAAKLRKKMVSGRLSFCDCNWDNLRPAIAEKLRVHVLPFANAPDSWHFWPNNFAACNLTQWELLEAVALSGKTSFTLHWLTVDFRLDTRSAPAARNVKF